jgi:nitrate reductase NapE component
MAPPVPLSFIHCVAWSTLNDRFFALFRLIWAAAAIALIGSFGTYQWLTRYINAPDGFPMLMPPPPHPPPTPSQKLQIQLRGRHYATVNASLDNRIAIHSLTTLFSDVAAPKSPPSMAIRWKLLTTFSFFIIHYSALWTTFFFSVSQNIQIRLHISPQIHFKIKEIYHLNPRKWQCPMSCCDENFRRLVDQVEMT